MLKEGNNSEAGAVCNSNGPEAGACLGDPKFVRSATKWWSLHQKEVLGQGFGDKALLGYPVPACCGFWWAWGPVLSSLLGSRRILQGWHAWTFQFFHPGHALLPTLRHLCWDLVADGVYKS